MSEIVPEMVSCFPLTNEDPVHTLGTTDVRYDNLDFTICWTPDSKIPRISRLFEILRIPDFQIPRMDGSFPLQIPNFLISRFSRLQLPIFSDSKH